MNYNGASTPEVATEESGRITIEQYVYPAGENGVSIEHYKFIGDHVWFEESFNGRRPLIDLGLCFSVQSIGRIE